MSYTNIAYVGLGFANVEGILIRADIIKHLVLTNYDKIMHFVNGKPEMDTMEVMNYVRLYVAKEDLFNPANLDFGHMHEWKDESEALKDFQNHLDYFRDIVDITLHAEDKSVIGRYYVDWDDADDDTNKSVTIEEEDNLLVIAIIKRGCE